jgi:hypothetical protein
MLYGASQLKSVALIMSAARIQLSLGSNPSPHIHQQAIKPHTLPHRAHDKYI